MNQRIACVGPREGVPPPILTWMEAIGAKIVRAGYTLVSGNGVGSDQAWARGGNTVNPFKVELCLPWRHFHRSALHANNVVRVLGGEAEDSDGRYFSTVASIHPHWGNLQPAGRRLQARNMMIIEGASMLLGYLHTSVPSGGTVNAFRIARRLQVPPNNIADEDVRAWVEEFFSRSGT